MVDSFFSSRGGGVLLFDEDFDLPPPPEPTLEPEVIEPLFTLAELKAEREEAVREGREAALKEFSASSVVTSGHALASIAEQMAAVRIEMASSAEQSAEAITRLLLDCFATAFPALSARHGASEAAAVLHEILPALHRETKITVRVNPHIAAAMTKEIQTLDADLAAHVRLVPTDAVAVGDARVTWKNGAASRDTASLWRQIENILAQAGLLNTELTVKEHELVE
jgi:flagellar biosynthesis/type III secretory pathway protein FliH